MHCALCTMRLLSLLSLQAAADNNLEKFTQEIENSDTSGCPALKIRKLHMRASAYHAKLFE